jgi:hypothetical protein
MAILNFLAEEPVRNDEQQDCCLIVEVHVPDWINEELVSWQRKKQSKMHSANG